VVGVFRVIVPNHAVQRACVIDVNHKIQFPGGNLQLCKIYVLRKGNLNGGGVSAQRWE